MAYCSKMRNEGFSIVELIIVIAIMAVLVGVVAPMYLKYVESSREAVDIQNMDSAYQLANAVYAEEPEIHGTYYYFFDGNDIKQGTKPVGYGKGSKINQRKQFENPCCEKGKYNPSEDYKGRYLVIQFPEPYVGEQKVHVHWSD